MRTPLQGTAADIIKLAMVDIHQQLEGQQAVRMIMQVHDELVFEIREDAVEQWLPKLQQRMENVAELSVPLKVEGGVGSNWDQAHG